MATENMSSAGKFEFDDLDGADLDDSEIKIAESTHKRIIEACVKTGYRDGVSDGEQFSLQSGFNSGYTPGFLNGYAISRLRGLFWAVSVAKNNYSGVEEFNAKLKEAEINLKSHRDICLPDVKQFFVIKCKEMQIEENLALELFNQSMENNSNKDVL